MIVEPPLDDGAVKATVNLPVLAVTVPIVGAPGKLAGLPDFAALAAPLPAEFTARIFTRYVVPIFNDLVEVESFEITNGDDVSAGLNAFHVVPLFVEYS